MNKSMVKRNVWLLSTCQALMMSSNALMITAAALVGLLLAEDKAFATLPLALQHIAAMLTSIPASLLMGRIGRKPAFMLATFIGATGGAVATLAILRGDFWLFCTGTACLGAFNGFGNYYRFAAADIADDDYKSRAISYVMAGGVIAAFVGPNLANWSQHLIADARFAGSYVFVIALYVLSFIALWFTSLPKPQIAGIKAAGRPLTEIMAQPTFIVAVIGAMFGYGIMSLVMTATPLAMHHNAHAFGSIALVIQLHILAMFAPSFVTGHLIRHFGVLNIMMIGGVLQFLCIAVNLSGHSVTHYWIALVLLGLAWNFLFVGGTTLLTETYRPEEKPKVQAANDFIVFSTVATAALSAGALQYSFGWQAVNMGVIPFTLLVLASLVWLKWLRPDNAMEKTLTRTAP